MCIVHQSIHMKCLLLFFPKKNNEKKKKKIVVCYNFA